MTEEDQIMVLEPPESARFVNARSSSASQYVIYTTGSSVIPSSFDQVLKNNAVLFTPDAFQMPQLPLKNQ